MPLVFGSICSGIGAPEMAWTSLGWRCAFMSEIEPFPRAVLSHHYPEVPLHGDFTTIQAGDYGAIDLLVGGTPCQSFSVAGLRGGMADERGNLALEYLRLAERLRPRWLVWENVPGVLSSAGGRDFGAFVGGLAEIGYGWAYRCLDAQHFGLAQRRLRVFVVAYLGDWQPAAAVLFEPASLRGDPAPRRYAGKGIAAPLAAGSPGGSGYRNDEDTADNLIAGTLNANGKAAGSATQQDAESGMLIAYGCNNTSGPIDVAGALNASHTASGRQDFEPETFIAHTLSAEGFDASEDGTGRGTPLVPVAFNAREDTVCTGPVAGALGASSPQDQAVAFSAKDHGADAGDLTPTLRAMGHAGSHPNGGGQVAVAMMSDVRRLTPRECERLQGFPDDWTLIPWRGKPPEQCPDGPRYKACGNSMAANCMAWIGRRLDAVDKGTPLP